MLRRIISLVAAFAIIISIASIASAAEPNTKVPEKLQISKLFAKLPSSYVSTPDGMAIHPKSGELIVACPNFGDQSLPGTIIKVTKSGSVQKWFDVPVNKKSGVARPMGIDFDKSGNLYIVDNQGWTGNPESVNQGRILKIEFDENDKVKKTTEIAVGMEHPNGIKIWGNYAYVTQSSLSKVKDPSGLLVSCVYRFNIKSSGIKVTNTLADKDIITTFITENKDCQYGADGLVFDKAGNLYVGDFGDGAVHKITFKSDYSVAENKVWAQNSKELTTTDGMCIDDKGNIYVADFSRNAIAKINPNGVVTRIAQSPDSNGANGQLDQPGEPIVFDGKLVVTCFDMVTDDGKINSKHDAPQTIAYIDFKDIK